MHQLDTGRAGDRVGVRGRVALGRVGGAQRDHGAEPLAAGRQQMPRGVAEETVVHTNRVREAALHAAQIGCERRDPDVVEDAHHADATRGNGPCPGSGAAVRAGVIRGTEARRRVPSTPWRSDDLRNRNRADRRHGSRRARAPAAIASAWLAAHPPASELSEKDANDARRQSGSLGSGNHFLELCTDERGDVWVVLHSGSRGIGNRLAQRHIESTLRLKFEHPLDDRDLAYLTQGTPEFDAYIADMLWAQSYAAANSDAMLQAALGVFAAVLGRRLAPSETVNVHHNYAALEHHGGRELWITPRRRRRASSSTSIPMPTRISPR